MGNRQFMVPHYSGAYSRAQPLPRSRIPLSGSLTDEELKVIAEDIFADGEIDGSELAAAIMVGGGSLMRMDSTGEFGERYVDTRDYTFDTSTPMGEWLSKPRRLRGLPPFEAERKGWMRAFRDGLVGEVKTPEDLRALRLLIPEGSLATADTIDAFLSFTKTLETSVEGWKEIGLMAQRLYSCGAAYAYYADRKRDLAADTFDLFKPNPEDVVDEVRAARLLAIASMPGIPNKAVHEALYDVLESRTFESSEAKAAFAEGVRDLHHTKTKLAVTLLQAPASDIAGAISNDRAELAAGLGTADGVKALVAVKGPDDDEVRLMSPVPGRTRSGFSPSLYSREIMIEPGTELDTARSGGFAQWAAAALAYADSHVETEQRLVIASSHGHNGLGPEGDRMSLAQLADAFTGITAPDLIAFDACSISAEALKTAFAHTGIELAHASPVRIDGSGFDYRRLAEDLGESLVTEGSPTSWIRPHRWYLGAYGRPTMPYRGALIRLS